MKINYRVTAWLTLTTWLLSIGIGYTTMNTSATGLDPCMMWEQMPVTAQIYILFAYGSFITLLIQGLRNRPAPRWIASAGLIALALTINHYSWRFEHCYTGVSLITSSIWLSTVVLMYAHQIARWPNPGVATSIKTPPA